MRPCRAAALKSSRLGKKTLRRAQHPDITKRDLLWNDALPKIEVDPETYTVKADGRELRCEPATVAPHGAALLPVLRAAYVTIHLHANARSDLVECRPSSSRGPAHAGQAPLARNRSGRNGIRLRSRDTPGDGDSS